jgi:hypothetical protein
MKRGATAVAVATMLGAGACQPVPDRAQPDTVSRAINGFVEGCLSSAPTYANWQRVFRNAGISSGNRQSYGMPRQFPAGDAITDPAVVRGNIGDPVVADCSVQIEGDHSGPATGVIRAFLGSPAFPLKEPSTLNYASPDPSDRVVFHRAYRVDGRNFSVLVQVRDTKTFGRLTTMNASLVNDRP